VGDWERLAGQLNASPFLWPGWIEAWWNTFGAGRLQILTVHHDGRLTGVLPLRRSNNTLSSTTNNQVPIFGFLAANETAAEKLTQTLFSQNVRRIDLPLLSNDNDFSLTRAAADARRYRMFSESVPGLPYAPVDEMSWEAYEKGLGKNLRGDVRRQRRRLEENGDLTLDIQDGTEGLEALLEEGFRVEGSGWKDAERTSIQSHPATRRFYTDVASWAGGIGC
jgi:CelD/BcsL family acetyltransferase involved in cellulose biosynthesis